jgi:thioredoxin reductase (NADPH)
MSNQHKEVEILIIGAGPAGLSMAAEAINSGIDKSAVVVIEKGQEHSWSIRKFYPEKKLVAANYKGKSAVCRGVMCISDMSKKEALSYLDKTIIDHDIEVHYKEEVQKITPLKNSDEDTLFEVVTNKEVFHTKICVIAIGIMGRPNKPSYSISSAVRPFVHFDITTKMMKDEHILVVGGGDSASEYVQFLHQQGNKVELSYRQETFTRMNHINYQSIMALSDSKNATLLMNTNIESLEYSNQKVLVHFSGNTPSKEYTQIVYALGGSTPVNFLKLIGIEFDGKSPVIKDAYETSIPGLFLVGDLSGGKQGGSIITAFNSSRDAMEKICQDYLSCTL